MHRSVILPRLHQAVAGSGVLLLIGGLFTTYDGVARSRIARVNAYGHATYVPAVFNSN
jgi:hypothetical protein